MSLHTVASNASVQDTVRVAPILSLISCQISDFTFPLLLFIIHCQSLKLNTKLTKTISFTERPPETRWRDTVAQRKWRRSWTSNILIINVCAVFAWKTQSPDWFGHFIIAVTNIWDIIHSGLFTRYNTYRCVLFLITFIKEICLYLLTQHKEISHSFITSQSEEMDSDG